MYLKYPSDVFIPIVFAIYFTFKNWAKDSIFNWILNVDFKCFLNVV